ncbi:hypothetical protein CBOM_06260 [Ceraceosorus bombacis]|uniref:Uncharacterized protein n=1 Tax=Ceraceosorus bombacis TaxID=401625 RepID=A0A0N7LAF1_9BASI|nr:hypothetical protein CBOM_06260 [Ceraceosorus bombacis]
MQKEIAGKGSWNPAPNTGTMMEKRAFDIHGNWLPVEINWNDRVSHSTHQNAITAAVNSWARHNEPTMQAFTLTHGFRPGEGKHLTTEADPGTPMFAMGFAYDHQGYPLKTPFKTAPGHGLQNYVVYPQAGRRWTYQRHNLRVDLTPDGRLPEGHFPSQDRGRARNRPTKFSLRGRRRSQNSPTVTRTNHAEGSAAQAQQSPSNLPDRSSTRFRLFGKEISSSEQAGPSARPQVASQFNEEVKANRTPKSIRLFGAEVPIGSHGGPVGPQKKVRAAENDDKAPAPKRIRLFGTDLPAHEGGRSPAQPPNRRSLPADQSIMRRGGAELEKIGRSIKTEVLLTRTLPKELASASEQAVKNEPVEVTFHQAVEGDYQRNAIRHAVQQFKENHAPELHRIKISRGFQRAPWLAKSRYKDGHVFAQGRAHNAEGKALPGHNLIPGEGRLEYPIYLAPGQRYTQKARGRQDRELVGTGKAWPEHPPVPSHERRPVPDPRGGWNRGWTQLSNVQSDGTSRRGWNTGDGKIKWFQGGRKKRLASLTQWEVTRSSQRLRVLGDSSSQSDPSVTSASNRKRPLGLDLNKTPPPSPDHRRRSVRIEKRGFDAAGNWKDVEIYYNKVTDPGHQEVLKEAINAWAKEKEPTMSRIKLKHGLKDVHNRSLGSLSEATIRHVYAAGIAWDDKAQRLPGHYRVPSDSTGTVFFPKTHYPIYLQKGQNYDYHIVGKHHMKVTGDGTVPPDHIPVSAEERAPISWTPGNHDRPWLKSLTKSTPSGSKARQEREDPPTKAAFKARRKFWENSGVASESHGGAAFKPKLRKRPLKEPQMMEADAHYVPPAVVDTSGGVAERLIAESHRAQTSEMPSSSATLHRSPSSPTSIERPLTASSVELSVEKTGTSVSSRKPSAASSGQQTPGSEFRNRTPRSTSPTSFPSPATIPASAATPEIVDHLRSVPKRPRTPRYLVAEEPAEQGHVQRSGSSSVDGPLRATPVSPTPSQHGPDHQSHGGTHLRRRALPHAHPVDDDIAVLFQDKVKGKEHQLALAESVRQAALFNPAIKQITIKGGFTTPRAENERGRLFALGVAFDKFGQKLKGPRQVPGADPKLYPIYLGKDVPHVYTPDVNRWVRQPFVGTGMYPTEHVRSGSAPGDVWNRHKFDGPRSALILAEKGIPIKGRHMKISRNVPYGVVHDSHPPTPTKDALWLQHHKHTVSEPASNPASQPSAREGAQSASGGKNRDLSTAGDRARSSQSKEGAHVDGARSDASIEESAATANHRASSTIERSGPASAGDSAASAHAHERSGPASAGESARSINVDEQHTAGDAAPSPHHTRQGPNLLPDDTRVPKRARTGKYKFIDLNKSPETADDTSA